jgi:O-acetyl-ADP-ribose deacetylase (regulator of RNase III)
MCKAYYIYYNIRYKNTKEKWKLEMLIHTRGNLIDLAEQGAFDVIVQGCNCYNTMGSGIAREIRERYPQAYEVDCQTEKGDIMKLGNWTAYDTGAFKIINAYTQYGFNSGGSTFDLFEYTSFQLILQKLFAEYGKCDIGFPYIGMGLAGGDKEKIIKMIEEFAEQVNALGGSVTLVEFG